MAKKTTANRLQEIMKTRNLRQVDILNKCIPLCKRYGIKFGRNDLSQYVSGKVAPGQAKLSVLAEALNVSESWLMGYDVPFERNISNIIPLERVHQVPLIGTIACGQPILADENIEGYLLLPNNVEADFALMCKGNSMIDARINDGDIVYIKQQPIVENGEIAAVLIDDEATLKRFYKNGDKVILKAENKDFEPLVYVNSEIDSISIIGKATYFLSKVEWLRSLKYEMQ